MLETTVIDNTSEITSRDNCRLHGVLFPYTSHPEGHSSKLGFWRLTPSRVLRLEQDSRLIVS